MAGRSLVRGVVQPAPQRAHPMSSTLTSRTSLQPIGGPTCPALRWSAMLVIVAAAPHSVCPYPSTTLHAAYERARAQPCAWPTALAMVRNAGAMVPTKNDAEKLLRRWQRRHVRARSKTRGAATATARAP